MPVALITSTAVNVYEQSAVEQAVMGHVPNGQPINKLLL